MACVSIAPDEPPMMYTRTGSPPYFISAYFTIWAMPCVSPPPSCFSDWSEPTSQQFWFGLSGRTRMHPCVSAADLNIGMLPSWPVAVEPHECAETTMGGLGAILSGTLMYICWLLGSVTPFVHVERDS